MSCCSLLSEKEIEWETLRELLKVAQKARSTYVPSKDDVDDDDKVQVSRQTIDLFFRFLTSKTGLFLKKPLVHELAAAIDGVASIGESNLIQATNGLLPPLPGMNGPVNDRVMAEMRMMLDTFQDALAVPDESTANSGGNVGARMEALMELIEELRTLLTDEKLRKDAGPLLDEVRSVIQMVALEVLEIRGSRAMRSILSLAPSR